MVEPTHLKLLQSQIGSFPRSFPQEDVKIKIIWTYHLDV